MQRPATIAVCGPGGEVAGDLVELAREVGALLAREGIGVVTGGLDGIMAAAAQGARQAGGQPVGILPGADPEAGNEYLSVRVTTGLGQLRNALLVNAVDGVIAVGGSWGTLSEIALAMRAGKPVVSIGGWNIVDAEGQPLALLVADTAAQAVELLRNALAWHPTPGGALSS